MPGVDFSLSRFSHRNTLDGLSGSLHTGKMADGLDEMRNHSKGDAASFVDVKSEVPASPPALESSKRE